MLVVVSTDELQKMVSRVSKCASNNKLIPLTSLMSVRVEEDSLYLTTTDATNYYYASTRAFIEKDEEEFEVSVISDTFAKLVMKTTSASITLEVSENVLKVTGNGVYKLELPLDETSKPIKFPNKVKGLELSTLATIKKSDVNTVINYNKPSLAIGVEIPALTYYYCGDSVITSDRYKICSTNIKLFDEPQLISGQVMELLSELPNENISVAKADEALIFISGGDIIYAPVTMDIAQFPIAAINKLIGSEFPSECVVNKNDVLGVLDRLSLFVSNYDKKGIYLTFDKGVLLSSKKSSGAEKVETTTENMQVFTCAIDIEMLKAQFATQQNDSVTIAYGSNMAIRLSAGNVVQVVSLAQDDRQ